MRKARWHLAMLAVTGAGLATPARALPPNPATATFNVTITILKECIVTAPATISLGSIGASDLLSTTTSASQTFGVTCSKGTPFTVGFSSANDLTTGSATHQMKGTGANTDVIQYNLLDTTSGATNTTPLSASTSVIAGTGTGVAQTKTLKAQVVNYVTAVTPDVYTDTVTMTVTY